MTIRSTCEKGFKVYLAEQHRRSMDNALGKGVVIGGLCSLLFFGLDRSMDLDAPWYMAPSIFVLLTAASIGGGVISMNSEDLEHKSAFDAVCGKYDKDDEEDGE